MPKNKVKKSLKKTNKEIVSKNLEEQYDYYKPKNEKEEREYNLARLIVLREDELKRDTRKLFDLEESIKISELEKKVHEQVLKNAGKDQAEDWKYYWPQDVLVLKDNEMEELRDEVQYNSAWIREAKKFITTKRYHHVPNEFLGLGFMEQTSCDCSDCDGSCEGDCCDAKGFEPMDAPF